uniref:CUB domain-containing protein n=1 Tax=Heterorhabditis bacteriophora TaxID=37862 RepID=A0A1I7WJE5_HETBA
MLQQHSSLAGTRREYSVEYAVFGGSSYSNYFVRLSLPFNLDLWLFTNYKPNTTKTDVFISVKESEQSRDYENITRPESLNRDYFGAKLSRIMITLKLLGLQAAIR